MKSTFAAKLLADLRECPALYPYADPAVLNSQRAQPLAARVTAVRLDAAAMLWDFRLVRVAAAIRAAIIEVAADSPAPESTNPQP